MKLTLPVTALCLLAAVCLSRCGQASSQNIIKDSSKHDVTYVNNVPLDSIGAVSWLARPGNTYFLNGTNNNEFYVYVQLRGNDVLKEEKPRAPLNISLVLDRSGSMSGDKIAYAKKAAAFVVEQLNNNDVLSVVNYDDRIEITSPSEHVKNKEVIKRKINELTDRGSTNLTGGMLEGYTQVKSTRKDGYVNRVLLLTDGLANTGITDPQQMKKITEKKFLEEGIALSTFGLGADYNEDLLTALAESGRANYYFIDNPDKIPNIFASELKGLLSVVAQNALVEITMPNTVELVKVYGYPYEVKGDKVQVRLNDIFSKDEKGMLLKFKTRSTAKEAIALNCHLRFTDATSFNTVDDNKTLQLKETSDNQLFKQQQDTLVQEMIALFEANETFDEIMTKVDAGDYRRAKVIADSMVVILKEKQKSVPSKKLKEQEEAIAVYSTKIDSVRTMRDEDKKLYQKKSKSENYEIKKGKKN